MASMNDGLQFNVVHLCQHYMTDHRQCASWRFEFISAVGDLQFAAFGADEFYEIVDVACESLSDIHAVDGEPYRSVSLLSYCLRRSMARWMIF